MKFVDPIRDECEIKKLKQYLSNNKRDLFYVVLSLNSGIRTGDLLKLKVGDLKYKKIGDQLQITEQKTCKTNYIVINKAISKAFQEYLDAYPDKTDAAFIFFSRKGNEPLNVFYVSRMVKRWATDLGLKGNIACHSFRKTWGYLMRTKFNIDWAVICRRYNHSNPAVTMRYLGITADEIHNICMNDI